MRTFLSTTFALALALSAQGQNPDSLLRLAAGFSQKDTQRVNLLNEAGIVFWKAGNDSMAVDCHEKAIAAARLIPFYKGEVEGRLQLVLMEMDYLSDLESAYAQLDSSLIAAKQAKDRHLEAQTYFRRGQLYSLGIWEHRDEIRPLYDKALEIFKELGDANREGMIYTQLAALEGDEGRFALAIDYLLKARKLQEQSGDLKPLRATIPNLGVMYMNIGLWEQALQCFAEAEKNAMKQNDERVLAFLSGQRGEIYLKQQKYEAALKELHEAETRQKKIGMFQFLTGTYARIGAAYLHTGQTDKAFLYASRADSLFKTMTDGEELLSHSAQIVLGDIFLKKGRYNEVIRLAEKGLDWAESASPMLLKEASDYHRQLALAFEKKGNLPQAVAHYKQYKTMSDSLLNAEMIQRGTASALGFQHEKAQQADQIRIQSLENDRLVQRQKVTFTLLLLGVGLLAAVFWVNRRLRQKNEALSRKNEEIQQALHEGQKIERKRVASELHDNLTTKIAVIRWQLENLDSTGFSGHNQKILNQLLDTTGDAYDDIRLISHNMAPAELETKGLPAALRKLVKQLETQGELAFKVNTNLEERMAVEVEYQLYHIALELVNNVIRHARATEAAIRLWQSADSLELSVSDDGTGLHSGDTDSPGMGLRNVEARAASLGGTFRMENQVTGGTTVKITIPLR